MRSYSLSAGRDGYRVMLLEIPMFHYVMTGIAYHACNLTGQYFCEFLCGKTGTWLLRAEKVVGEIDISADKVKEIDRDFWSIFEEEDDES